MPVNPLTDPNWAANLTNKVDHYVGLVRDNATVKVVTVVRAVVFGLIAGILGLIAVVVGAILAIRLVQRLVRLVARVDHNSAVWISYFVIAVLLVGLGAFLMSKRHTPTA